MEVNHRIKSFEEAMEEIEAIRRQEDAKSANGNVPCNGCTLCCLNDAIRILPEDDASKYQTVPHEHFIGHLMLDHKPNGECVYLTNNGCGIHDTKPTMCREMDCRRIFKSVKQRNLKRYNIPMRVWNKGKQLSCR